MSYVYNSAIRYNIKMEFTLGKLGEKWPWKLNKKATKRFYMSFLSIFKKKNVISKIMKIKLRSERNRLSFIPITNVLTC